MYTGRRLIVLTASFFVQKLKQLIELNLFTESIFRASCDGIVILYIYYTLLYQIIILINIYVTAKDLFILPSGLWRLE
jgi:hypothetical protein